MPRLLTKSSCIICAVLVYMLAAVPGSFGKTQVEPPAEFLQQVESNTLLKLDAIEKHLQENIEKSDPSYSDRLRDKLIHLSMWPPVAGCSQWFLETLGDSRTARNVFFFAMPLVKWMSDPFILPTETEGPDAEKDIARVFKLISDLRSKGMSVSLDNVGDASLSQEDALLYRRYYKTLMERFIASDTIPELAVSIKLSALVDDLESAISGNDSSKKSAKRNEIKSAIAELLKTAAGTEKRIFIRIDMEEYAFKDLTLALFKEAVEENPSLIRNRDGSLRLGVVIQAYLRDSAHDVVELAKWARERNLRAPIRLVKGAYLTHEREEAAKEHRKSPVWNFKPSTDANYEGICTYMLLNRDALQPAFATHNIRSMAHVMALAEELGIPSKEIELQMLYGMGDPIKTVVVSMGYAMREYIPAGSLARGLKYAGRRFHELSSGDNALTRTLRGDFSAAVGTPPAFIGDEDIADGMFVKQAVLQSLEK
ncbi:proline dehydrogenase family protein [Maridesulfovibrio sp.]|uniref:proline dehydrogenase family protein n=1 Tax=Maridesulfovibrio sp. TaxID=2795000 RepID=UPI002A18BF03|nr:proline dehydrogenase family protein [Maridesulfovibrio sp.]